MMKTLSAETFKMYSKGHEEILSSELSEIYQENIFCEIFKISQRNYNENFLFAKYLENMLQA